MTFRLPRSAVLFALALAVSFGWGSAIAQEDFSVSSEDRSVPIRFRADELDARGLRAGQGGSLEASGNVTVEWSERVLEADRVAYDPESGVLNAEGSVRISDDLGNELKCESATLRLDDLSGVVTDGELHLTEPGYHVTGERFERTGTDTLKAKGATFSACDGSALSWRVDADWIDVKREGFLTGGGGVFRMGDVPLLWLPWFAYPFKFERQSGFLTPDVGYSTSEGYQAKVPYFWAFSESADLLLRVDYRSREGWAEYAKLRYVLAEDHEGSFGVEHFNRRSSGHSLDVFADHESFFDNGTQIDLHVDYVGDEERKRDFSDTLDDRAILRIENHLVVSRGYTPGTLYALGRYTQAFSQPQAEVLQTLPSLGLVGAEEPFWGPLYGRLDADVTRFWRSDDDLDQATRLRVDPALALDLGGMGVGLSTRAGYRQHYYVEEGDEVLRGGAWAEAAGRMTFHRRFGALSHLIEPRVGYRWEDAGNGDEVLEFDDDDIFVHRSELDFSIETLLLDRETGRPLLDLDIRRALDLRAALDGDFSGDDWLPWRGELFSEPWEGIGLLADGDFDPRAHDPWLRWSTGAWAKNKRGDSLFYNQQYLKNEANYIDGGVTIVLSRLFRLRYRNRHSFRDERNLEQEGAFIITHNCWELNTRLSRIWREDDEDYDYRIFFAFSLKGLGRSREGIW